MTKIIALIITALVLAALLATPVYAAFPEGNPGQSMPSTPSAPVDPASTTSPADRDPSAQRTNYAFAEDGSTHRKVVSDYCYWWSGPICKK